jgi:hypothetical protein
VENWDPLPPTLPVSHRTWKTAPFRPTPVFHTSHRPDDDYPSIWILKDKEAGGLRPPSTYPMHKCNCRRRTDVVDTGQREPANHHGSRLTTVSSHGRIRLCRLSWQSLTSYLKAATSACLLADERQRYLGETPLAARAAFEVCEERHGRQPG